MKSKSLFLFLFCFLFSISIAQLPNYVSSAAIRGWYSFNGNAMDLSGMINHGTVNNAMLTTNQGGLAASAYSFSSNSNITTPFVPLTNASFAMFADFYANSISTSLGGGTQGAGNTLVSSDKNGVGGFVIGIASGSMTALSGSTWLGTAYTFSPNTWYKVGANFNSVAQTVEFFVNGASVGTNTVPAFQSFTPDNINIGYNPLAAWNYPFDGKIDEVGIWQRTLTLCEIEQLYHASKFTFTLQPINQTVTPNSTAQFSVSSVYPGVTYQWQILAGMSFTNLTNAGQFSSVNTATLAVSNVTTQNIGSQFRCIITAGNCTLASNTATLMTAAPTGISEQSANTAGSIIYPNPSSGLFFVKGSVNSLVEVFDAQGKLIVSQKQINHESFIDLRNQPDGIYLVRCADSNRSYTLRYIKAK